MVKMDGSIIEHQLRQLKRRRIEIRSTKAALDLEDLDLDDKQSQLEGFLQSRNIDRPVSTVEVKDQANDEASQIPRSASHATSRSGHVNLNTTTPSHKRHMSKITKDPTEVDASVVRKKRPTAMSSTIAHGISNKPGCDAHSNSVGAHDGDVIMTGARKKRPSPSRSTTNTVTSTKRKRSPLWKAGFGQSLSPEPVVEEKAMPTATRNKKSKIVTLKVRVDPRMLQNQRLCGASEHRSNETSPSHPAQMDPSKVIESIRPYLRPQQRVSAVTQPSSSSTAITSSTSASESTISSNFDLNFASPRQAGQHFQARSHVHRPDSTFNEGFHLVSHSSPTSTHFSPSSTTTSTSISVSQSPAKTGSSGQHSAPDRASVSPLPSLPARYPACACQDRDPDCRRCRGTPAAIAESRSLLVDNSPLRPMSRSHIPPHCRDMQTPSILLGSTGTLTPITQSTALHQSPNQHFISQPTNRGRRDITSQSRLRVGPSTYLIPDFEEMTSTEQRHLELRFCHRILAQLSPFNTDSTPTPDHNFTIRIPAHILEMMSQHLSKLLQHTSGDLAGDTCRDKDDFATALAALIHDFTLTHPSCCAGIGGTVKSDAEHGTGTAVGGMCWRADMQAWARTRMRRCEDCIEACVSAVNDAERRKLVDEWEV